MKCKNCGRPDVPDGAAYCCWCGKKVVAGRKKKTEILVPTPRQMTSGTWYIYLRLKGQPGISVTAETEAECRAKAQAIKAQLISPEIAKKMPLRKALAKLIESKAEVRSPSTIRGYQKIMDTRFKACMDWDIYHTTDAQWQRAITQELKLCAPKTVVNAWHLVAAAIKKETGKSPEVSLPAIPKKPRPYLDAEQIKVFCAAIAGTAIEIPSLLALCSLRRGEVMALNWEDVDLNHRIISVHRSKVMDDKGQWIINETAKTDESSRTVPILMDQLYQALQAVPEKHGPVMTIGPAGWRNQLDRVCAAEGLPPITVHCLRHSFASLAAHLGLRKDIAMAIGGWKDAKIMDDVYTHIYLTDMNAAQNVMSAFYNDDAEQIVN